MMRKTKRLFFLFMILLAASIACNIYRYFPTFEDQGGAGDAFCDGSLIFSDDYKIYCSEGKTPIENNFSGSVTNIGMGYAHNVNFEILFPIGMPQIRCPFQIDQIAPGESYPLLCQFTASQCYADQNIAEIKEGPCNYVTYPEHLDLIAIENEENPLEPETEPELVDTIPEQAETFTLTQSDIELLNEKWIEVIDDNPCQLDLAKQSYNTWVNQQAAVWAGETGSIIGEGLQWATLESFSDWLIAQAQIDQDAIITKTWNGTFQLSNTPTIPCHLCVPGAYTCTIDFSISMDTCTVGGTIQCNGEGPAVQSQCDENLTNPCSGYGSYTITGKISGTADSSGQLSFDEVVTTFSGTRTWEGNCEGGTGTKTSSWKSYFTMTGKVDWKGSASGNFTASGVSNCAKTASWTAELK
jgi:hypothetical protein